MKRFNTNRLFRQLALLVAIIGFSCINSPAAGYMLAGRVFDEEQNPLEGILVHLAKEDDSDVVLEDFTDEEGAFRFDSVPGGSYYLSLSGPGFETVDVDGYAVNCDMTKIRVRMQRDGNAPAKDLEEVEVIAKALQSYADRDEMYLSAYNRKFGVNALDAISSLPRFIPSINGNVLMNNQMDEVNILIDGRRATAQDLQNLSGNDIAKVVYYQDAPAKFRGLYGGAIANIILKKPKQISIKGNLNAGTALTSASTRESAGLVMMSPTGILNAAYNFNYSNNTSLKENTVYDYGDLKDSFQTNSMRNEGKRNSANISYQYDKGADMLFARFDYTSSDRHERYDEAMIEQTALAAITGQRLSSSHRIGDSFSLNLYYSHQFSGGRELMVDVVGNINKNRFSNRIDQLPGEGSAYDDFRIDNSTVGNLKSVITNLSFTSPLWGGSASVSLLDHYRHLHQNFFDSYFSDLSSVNVSDENFTMIAAGYNRQFGKFGMAVDLSVFYNRIILTDKSAKDYVTLYPKLSLSYNAASWLFLNAMTWSEGSLAGLGAQNINRSFIDTRYFRENILYRKPSQRYRASLSADFSIPEAKLMVCPSVTYTWEHNGYFNYVYREGNDFISRPTLLPCSNSINYMLFAVWMPVDGLQIRPYITGDYMAYRTPAGRERFNALYFQLMGAYTFRNFQFNAYLCSPRRRIAGVTRSYQGWNASVSAYWNISAFYAGLDFNYNGDTSWQLIEVPGFSSRVEQTNLNMRHNVAISLGYKFNIGKFNRAAKAKKLYNKENEDGL